MDATKSEAYAPLVTALEGVEETIFHLSTSPNLYEAICENLRTSGLAHPGSRLVPSIAHRMAADESTKDALADALHRFVTDPAQTPERAQERLVAIVRGAAR